MPIPVAAIALAQLADLPFTGASVAPTWTDKEVLIAVGSVVGTLLTVGVPLVLFLMRLAGVGARERTRKALEENQRLRDRLKALDNAPPKEQDGETESLAEIKASLEHARQELRQMNEGLAEATAREINLRQSASQMGADLSAAQAALGAHLGKLDTERRRIDRALQKDGHTWIEKVKAGAPEFKPLHPEGRRMPIISVLNLKGGVGKTTLTANLGAALDQLGYRVLLLDLDLQGSLTSLFMNEFEQAGAVKSGKLLGEFFAASFDAEFPNLNNYTQAILPDGKSAIVPTTDQLAYAEMNLTIRWLLREGNRDPRFMLRKELHMRRITNLYDVVLLDCPPLINVTCVNALAASDYVLVPILPSKQATARAPVLLDMLKGFRDNINSSLNVLGVVANRTHRGELTYEEQNRLTALRGQCKDIWGLEVPLFETFIRQNAGIRTAEDEHRSLNPNDEIYPSFLELAREVESRLPMFCRPRPVTATATVEERVT